MGRPLQHDKQQVVTEAMKLFWSKGYTATSMAELLSATGLKSGSLYASFQSKQGLFLQALDHFAEVGLTNVKSVLTASDKEADNLYALFEFVIEGQQFQGCFLVNTLVELAPHDEAISERVKEHLNNVENAVALCLSRALCKQQLKDSVDIQAQAKQLMINIWGIRVMQRAGLDIQQKAALKQQYKSYLLDLFD